MSANPRFTTAEALRIGEALGVDWSRLDLEEFRRGVELELHHWRQDMETNPTNADPVATAKIALAHLKDDPDYYARGGSSS